MCVPALCVPALTNCRFGAQMCRHYALGCLLGTLVLAAQVGPARAYSCTSDADCAYATCNDFSCSGYESYSRCNNGVWDATCVSTTYTSTTKQAETLCTVLSLSRITLLWRVLESGD